MKKLNNVPTVKVAIKKNVLKTYQVDDVETVYLKNKTEFQIELFNPYSEKLKCIIELNGLNISGSGFVLNPGQRVFLDRYLDENRKFKFSTYDVDDTDEVKDIIKNNGLIKVSFYREHIPFYVPNYTPTIYYYNGTITTGGTINTTGITTNNVTYSSGTNIGGYVTPTCSTVETGIIEKGSESNQVFTNDYTTFHPFVDSIKIIKILPESQKLYTLDDIKHKNYCPECGIKLKENYKYCPNCGHKIS